MLGLVVVVGIFLIVFPCIVNALKKSPLDQIRYILAFCISTLGIIGLFGESIGKDKLETSPLINTILLPYGALILFFISALVVYRFLRCLNAWREWKLEKDLESIDQKIKKMKDEKKQTVSFREGKC